MSKIRPSVPESIVPATLPDYTAPVKAASAAANTSPDLCMRTNIRGWLADCAMAFAMISTSIPVAFALCVLGWKWAILPALVFVFVATHLIWRANVRAIERRRKQAALRARLAEACGLRAEDLL